MGGTPTLTLLSPTGTPPRPRQGHQAVYDPNTNSMIVWGGQDGGGSFCDTFSEVWVLHNANGLGGIPNWTQLLFTGGPPAGQYFSTAVYDSSNNILIVFGGFGLVGGNCSALTNAVWALSHANGIGGTQVWTNLTAQDAAGSPANRAQQAAVYRPSTNRMTISGGSDSNGGLNDTWVLSNANGLGVTPPVWKQLQFTGNIPGPSSRWNAGVIDTVNNLTIMSFGTGNSDGPQWGTWILTNPSGSSTTAR